MSITPDQYKLIRRLKINGWSDRRIAKELGLSRKTVRKYGEGGALPDERTPRKTSTDLVSEVTLRQEAIKKVILEFVTNTKNDTGGKQKLTYKMVYEYVKQLFDVSYPTVCRYMQDIIEKKSEGFLVLNFDPGEAMQVDYCEIKLNIEGQIITCQLFCSILAYSGMIFCMLLPDKKLENLVDAHVEAFKYYKGVTKRIIYDNCSTIVMTGTGKRAIPNKSFLIFEGHYGFESTFTNPYKPNEKGLIENLCSFIRKLAFTPIPKGQTLAEIQASAILKIDDYNKHHKKNRAPKPIYEMYEEEINHLIKLPVKEYHCYKEQQFIVDKFSTITIDTNRYSVPVEFINKLISVKMSPYDISIWHKGILVHTHVRSLAKKSDIFLLEHYLDLLQKKKRAIPNSAVVKTGKVPIEIAEFRSKCSEPDKFEQVVKVMLLGKYVDVDLLLEAVREVNKTNKPTYQKVVKHLEAMKYLRRDEFEGSFLDFDDVEKIDIVNDDLDNYDKFFKKDIKNAKLPKK